MKEFLRVSFRHEDKTLFDCPRRNKKPSVRLSIGGVLWPRMVTVGLLTAVIPLFFPANLCSAPPTLKRLFPAGGQRGSKVVVTCTGDFSWPVKVWAPGIEAVPVEDEGKLEITIPHDLAADRVWIRLYNDEGISAAAAFLIGNLKELEEEEPNNSRHDAQMISENSVTVNGVLQATGDVDAFAVSLEVGQTLVAAVDANTRFGSPIDGILQVASTDGFVLAENHDDLGIDPRLTFRAKKSGTYIVRLFAFPSSPNSNIGFGGDESNIYRLTVTTGPFITHAIPLSVSLADPGAVKVCGWNIPADTMLPVVGYGGTWLNEYQEFESSGTRKISPDARLGFAFASHFSGAARVRMAPYPILSDVVETNANNPMRLVPPIAVTGRLQTPRDVDDFHVPLQKGQQVVVSIDSQNLYLPLLPYLRLIDPSGAIVAEADNPSKSRESVFTHVAAQDGDYRLTVGDLYFHGGDRYVYCLTVRIEKPDFELSASGDAITVTAEKPSDFEVTVLRRGTPNESIGPITIEAVNLPPGVMAPVVISEPTGSTAEKVVLKFSTEGTGFSGPIRIVGTASEPREVQRIVRTPEKFSNRFETIWLTAVAK